MFLSLSFSPITPLVTLFIHLFIYLFPLWLLFVFLYLSIRLIFQIVFLTILRDLMDGIFIAALIMHLIEFGMVPPIIFKKEMKLQKEVNVQLLLILEEIIILLEFNLNKSLHILIVSLFPFLFYSSFLSSLYLYLFNYFFLL